jgi:hypothetical protein
LTTQFRGHRKVAGMHQLIADIQANLGRIHLVITSFVNECRDSRSAFGPANRRDKPL